MTQLTNRERFRLQARGLEFRPLPLPLRRAAVRLLLPDPFENVIAPADPQRAALIFIHVPKTAGTSVTQAFGRPARHIPLSRYFAADPVRARRLFKAAFVRNPVERLHSAFNYLHSAIGVNRALDVRWAEAHLARFRSFPEFVEALADAGTRRTILGWTHFRPQTDWIVDRPGGKVAVDFLGRFEALEADLHRLCGHLGLDPVNIGHARRPHRARGEHRLSPALLDIVHDIYRSDFETLGYDRE